MIPFAHIQKDRFAKQLAIAVFLLGCCMTLIFSAVRYYLDYQRQNEAIHDQLAIIEDLLIPEIAHNMLLENSHNSLLQKLERLVYSTSIAQAKLVWLSDELTLNVGEKLEKLFHEEQFPIVSRQGGHDEVLGQLSISFDIQPHAQTAWRWFLFFCLAGVIQSLILSVLVYWYVRHAVSRHLLQIASFLQTAALHNHRLTLDRPDRMLRDELDAVVDGINELRQASMEKTQWDVSIDSNANQPLPASVELEKTLQQKSSLLRILYHDIANPLSIIAGSAEILNMPDISPDVQNSRSQAIFRASQLISEILNHVRYIDQIQGRQHDVQLQSVKLEDIFEKLRFLFADRLRQKNLELVIENRLPQETKCLADPITLSHQVINNLVSNAIKFSYPNSQIKIIADQDEQQRIHLRVQDKGIGIPEEILETIFDSKMGKTRPGTLGEEGNGFGMSLVKTFVESYGGEVEVESLDAKKSPEKHGSTIHVYLKTA
ncbi:MAG: sensor histidine kinase [Oligoflexus sp.]